MGAGFSSLYCKIHYIEVHYIEVWVYLVPKYVVKYSLMKMLMCGLAIMAAGNWIKKHAKQYQIPKIALSLWPTKSVLDGVSR